MTVNMDSAPAQGNRIKSAGLYSVQYFTTENTEYSEFKCITR